MFAFPYPNRETAEKMDKTWREAGLVPASASRPRGSMEDPRPFDWTDKGSVVVRRVDAIAVYTDSEGDIIIRQQRADLPDDVIIAIPYKHAYSVIEGIQRQLKGSLVTPGNVPAGT